MNNGHDSFTLSERKNKRILSEMYSLPHYGVPHPGLSSQTPELMAQQSRYKVILRATIEATELVILALIMFICIRSVVQNYVVMGDSMQPSFESGQFLVVNRLAYKSINASWLPEFAEFEHSFGTPQIGEVVVFPRGGETGYDLIKRVVATGGQSIMMIDGVVYLNGEILPEPRIVRSGSDSWGPLMIPEGFIFVLGDNRSNSMDSRVFGPVAETVLIGRVDLRYWPVNSMSRISHDLD